MKTLFKSVFALGIFACLLLTIAPSVNGQSVTYDTPTTSLTGGTNNVSATTTNTSFSVIIDAPRSTYVGLQPVFSLTGAGTSAVVFKFDKSLDRVHWESGGATVSVTANGTNVVTAASSVTLGAIGYLKLTTVENPNASAITNLWLIPSRKNGL